MIFCSNRPSALFSAVQPVHNSCCARRVHSCPGSRRYLRTNVLNSTDQKPGGCEDSSFFAIPGSGDIGTSPLSHLVLPETSRLFAPTGYAHGIFPSPIQPEPAACMSGRDKPRDS